MDLFYHHDRTYTVIPSLAIQCERGGTAVSAGKNLPAYRKKLYTIILISTYSVIEADENADWDEHGPLLSPRLDIYSGPQPGDTM